MIDASFSMFGTRLFVHNQSSWPKCINYIDTVSCHVEPSGIWAIWSLEKLLMNIHGLAKANIRGKRIVDSKMSRNKITMTTRHEQVKAF